MLHPGPVKLKRNSAEEVPRLWAAVAVVAALEPTTRILKWGRTFGGPCRLNIARCDAAMMADRRCGRPRLPQRLALFCMPPNATSGRAADWTDSPRIKSAIVPTDVGIVRRQELRRRPG